MPDNAADFSKRLLGWYKQHGRHNFPWQKQKSAYGFWIAEVMLQQTQATTVVPYFNRWMAELPDINSLAHASEDTVMGLWSGLGYYRRARFLHTAAQVIVEKHQGVFPTTLDEAMALRGLGRSSASAILAQAYNQSHAILDGNVKRVMARMYAIEGWPGTGKIEKLLWEKAEHHTPKKHVADYTQAIMDLGATVCTRKKPKCDECPVELYCKAKSENRTHDIPFSKPKKAKPERATTMLICQSPNGDVLLQKRSELGIWPNLWSLPECQSPETTDAFIQRHGLTIASSTTLESFKHTFSHYHLMITPKLMKLKHKPKTKPVLRSDDNFLWYDARQLKTLGLPAPVRNLLASL